MTTEKKIDLTITDFYKHKWRKTDFLTEDDIRCRLFCFLQLKFKEDKNISIHSEIRWYGKESKKLTYRSDIVILDNKSLSLNDKFQICIFHFILPPVSLPAFHFFESQTSI